MMSDKNKSDLILLRSYPKTRSELPLEYQRVHEDMYLQSREGKNLGSAIALKLEQWMHRQAVRNPCFPLLEIGAGNFNHIPFEPSKGTYDAIEPAEYLYRNSKNKNRINKLYPSIFNLTERPTYQRIISIAVLEHVLDLPALVAASALLLKKDGNFTAGIPTEGGLLWYLAWRFGTGPFFRRRYKLSYKPFIKYEHVNTEKEILHIIKIFFKSVKIKRYPLFVKHLGLYTHIEAKDPDLEFARSWLSRLDDIEIRNFLRTLSA